MNNNLGGRLITVPLFDLALYLFAFLCPIFFLKPMDLNMVQGIFFVFGTFALLAISLFTKREINYSNKLLGLIILWSLLNVFIHTFKFSLTHSLVASFMNYCLLSEGFIYILCSCLLFYLIVSSKKSFDIFYPILIINILNLIFSITQSVGIHWIWANNQSISGLMGTFSQLCVFSAISIPILAKRNYLLALIPLICMSLSFSFTGIFALLLTGIIYCIYNHKVIFMSTIVLPVAVFTFILNHYWLIKKLLVRMELWAYSLKEIFHSPIFGNGFDNSINMNTIPSYLNGGRTYRHNDLLNITRDLGVVFSAILVITVFKILKNSKKDYLFWSIIIAIISCLWQTNMYFIRISSMVIILLAVKERQNIDGNEALG